MSHEKKFSQFESKCIYAEVKNQFCFTFSHQLVFAQLTPTQAVEYIAKKAGVAVDENWINSAARRG